MTHAHCIFAAPAMFVLSYLHYRLRGAHPATHEMPTTHHHLLTSPAARMGKCGIFLHRTRLRLPPAAALRHARRTAAVTPAAQGLLLHRAIATPRPFIAAFAVSAGTLLRCSPRLISASCTRGEYINLNLGEKYKQASLLLAGGNNGRMAANRLWRRISSNRRLNRQRCVNA